MALDGNYALIGFDGNHYNGWARSGSAFLFNLTSGQIVHKFIVPDNGANDGFGNSVALNGNYALIGSSRDSDNGDNSGSAYLFDISSGKLRQKFIAPDAARIDYFGKSVALNENYVLIGSPRDDDNGQDSGSAYLFDIGSGELRQKFIYPDSFSHSNFGQSVALNGDYALIGSPKDWDESLGGGGGAGSAYLFDLSSGDLLQKFIAPDAASNDNLGYSLAIDDRYVLIGSSKESDNGTWSGSAYLFDLSSGDFLQKFIPFNGTNYDSFRQSVALNGDSVLIGSSSDDKGRYSGSAYLFTIE